MLLYDRNSWIQRITEASESYRRRKKYLDLQEETCNDFLFLLLLGTSNFTSLSFFIILVRKSRGQGVGLLIVTVVEASNLIVGDITGDLVLLVCE